MTNPNILFFILLPLIFSPNSEFLRFARGGKRRVHIPDDLHDVIDDEEDDDWKQWGKKSTPAFEGPHPSELEHMDMWQIQDLMMKQKTGPVFGFVKLRLGVHRTKDMVAEMAMKWTKVFRTGSVDIRFTGVDTNTIMFTLQNGRQSMELKEFILEEEEAYEIKIGDNIFRRPGDPPFEELVLKLQNEKDNVNETTASKVDEHQKEEL
ncbi:uncharacterized protein [Euphorbia lathyris]|uniref:uncharacterized protein n=1 Tax=Euphorbia lathyris TaxID=212925 RepID=UPI003313FDB7